MRISYIELSGFRGFKDPVRLNFPAGFVVLTGRNGAGKSTVLDAVDFALTGTIDKFAVKNAKKGGLESHIWWIGEGSPHDHYVRVGFVDGAGHEFSITRTRERGMTPSAEEAARLLCSFPVPGDWAKILVNTSLIRDETLAGLSMDLPEQARFEAVRAAIGGLTGPDHSPRTAALVESAKTARDEQEARLNQLQAELGRILTALTEARSILDRQADSAEAEAIIKRIIPGFAFDGTDTSENLRRLIAARKQTAQAIEQALGEAEQLLGEIRRFQSTEGQAELQTLQSRQEELSVSLAAANGELQQAEALVASELDADRFATHMVELLNHGEQIGLVDGHCPLCDAARSNEEFAEAIRAARARLQSRGQAAARAAEHISAVQERVNETEAEITRLRAESLTRRHSEQQFKERLVQIGTLFEQHGFRSSPNEPEFARDELLKWQEDTAEIERALFILEASGAHDRVSALQSRIEQTRTLIDAQAVRLTAAERALVSAKQIDKASKTIANQILTEQFDTVLPLLKELYKRLRPHASWREIEADFGGQVRASLNFTVGEGKNPQFLFSSGQRRAAGLAFLLAIHLSRPWTTLGSLLLDDPVQHIDDYRALNLVEVLGAIRRLGRQVIVAVEDTALADLLCRRLRSTPDEVGRRFDLAMGSNGSALIEHQTDLLPLPREVIQLSRAS